MPRGGQSTVFGLRGQDVLRHSVAVVVCALAAHAAAYGAIVPEDSVHGYFAWYAPTVAVLSTLAIAGTIAALVVGLVAGSESAPSAVIRAVLPPESRQRSAMHRLLGLASAALAFLTVQETLERSLAVGRLELVTFAPFTIATIVLAVLATAAAIAIVGRVVRSLAVIVFRERRQPRTRTTRRPRFLPRSVRHAGPRPLTVHGGLRAPPFLA